MAGNFADIQELLKRPWNEIHSACGGNFVDIQELELLWNEIHAACGGNSQDIWETNSDLSEDFSFQLLPAVSKETSTVGSDLKYTFGNNGSTSRPLPRAGNYSQTAPLEPQFPGFRYSAHDGSSNSPLIYTGNNQHVAPSSEPPPRKTGKKRSYEVYSVEEEAKLIQAVATHGRKWEKIAEILEGTRTANQWKQKWKHMMKKAFNKTDDEVRQELHIRAAVVQVREKKILSSRRHSKNGRTRSRNKGFRRKVAK